MDRRRSLDEAGDAPPSYASIYSVTPEQQFEDGEGDPQRRNIPSPVSYDAPSSLSGDDRPRLELVRGAAHNVAKPHTSYVADHNMKPLAGEDTPMVAMPPLSSNWRGALDGECGTPLTLQETSFATPVPSTVRVTDLDEDAVDDMPKSAASSEPPPMSAAEMGASNLDVYNGNESPDHRPNYNPDSAHTGHIHVRLTKEDEQDADNGNAPELDHMRQQSAATSVAAVPETQTTTPSSRLGAICDTCCQRKRTCRLIVILSVVVPCLLLFLLMFPLSFIYVEHYQLALKRTKSTGFVDTNTIYYPGCYVLGPDMEFRYFDKTANFVEFKKLEVTTVDKLTFTLSFSFQYYPKQEEIGKIYDMFELDYDPVIRSVAQSSIKNEAVKFSFDEFKSKRSHMEQLFHNVLKKRFEGDCHLKPSSDKTSCNQAYHITVPYFQLGGIDTPSSLMDRLLLRSIARELTETEKFKLEYAVVEKETDRQVKAIENAAAEILANATAQATYINMVAQANADVTTVTAHTTALRQMCANISINRNDYKISMYYINTIKHSKHIHVVPDVTYKSIWAQNT